MAALWWASAVVGASAAPPPPSPPPLKPYPEIHGGKRSGVIPDASPDPYQNYEWDLEALGAKRFDYQQYTDLATNLSFIPAGSFREATNASSFVVLGPGLVTVRFAQEAACWIEFDSDDMEGAGGALDVSISEGAIRGEVYRIKPKQYGATYRVEPNAQLYEGVWYAFVNVTAAGSTPWTVANFRRVCQVVPTNYKGSFHSSDPFLNRVWYVGAYTVKVTEVGNGIDSVGGYLGSELKDRGDRIAFLGDAHVTQASALAAFGNFDLLARSNNYTKNIANNIQPYWVMWVMSVLDLHDATADDATFLGLQSWIERRLDFALVVAGPTGPSLTWSRDDDRMGFGFESPDRPEAKRAFLALLAGAARRYADKIGGLGNSTAAAKYGDLAATITERIRGSPDWPAGWGMHASSDAINAGVVTPAEMAAMLAPAGALGDPLQLPSLSLFETYFVLHALGRANATAQALYLIRRHYGGMLGLGATTTWERFDPQWTDAGCLTPESTPVNAMNQDTSMAHPWAAGATAWLTAHGLGVRPTAPGYRRWVALPTLVDGVELTAVKGTVPTPSGTIRVDYNITRGTLQVEVPADTVAEWVGLPKLGGCLRQVWDLGTSTVLFSNGSTPSRGVVHDDRFVYIANVPPGRHELAFVLEDAAEPRAALLTGPWDPRNTSFNYAATFVGMDKTTSGAWRGRYGSKGYVLFAAGENGSDVTQLPPFIGGVYAASVVPKQGGPPYPDPSTEACGQVRGRVYSCRLWGTRTTDPRVLEAAGGGTDRVLGGVTSHGWASFHVDVDTVGSSKVARYNVTFFMLDADRLHIKQALKVRDGRTLHTVAPMVLVDDFAAAGAYVTYEYDGPLRVRLNEVPTIAGDINGFPGRPVVSGVFFD